jgi:hypothetical protein
MLEIHFEIIFFAQLIARVSAVRVARFVNSTDAGAECKPPLFLTEEDAPFYSFAWERYSPASFARSCLPSSRGDPELPRQGSLGSCAAVGASPNSYGSRSGSAVDSHAAVFRAGICDNTTLRKYGTDIGVRTTFCVSFTDEQGLAPGSRLVVPVTTWQFLANLKKQAVSGACRKRLLLMHPRYLADASGRFASTPGTRAPDAKPFEQSGGYYDPDCLARSAKDAVRSCPQILAFSSGFYAVLLALDLCTSVDVYGFDTDERAEAPYGHLHNDPASVGAARRVGDHSHPFPLERHLLKSWDAQGRLHLHAATKLPATSGPHATGAAALLHGA